MKDITGRAKQKKSNQIWVSGSRSWISWVIQIWFIGVIPFHRNFHGLIKSPQVDPARIHDLQRWLMDPIHRDLFRYEGVALRATDPWHGTESAEDFQDVSACFSISALPILPCNLKVLAFSCQSAWGGPGCPDVEEILPWDNGRLHDPLRQPYELEVPQSMQRLDHRLRSFFLSGGGVISTRDPISCPKT